MTLIFLFLFKILLFKIYLQISEYIYEPNNSSCTETFSKSAGKKINMQQINSGRKLHSEIKMWYVYETAVGIAAISIFL